MNALSELSQSELVSLAVYGLIGLYLSMAIARLFRGRLLAGFVSLAFWAAAMLAVVTGYSYRAELQAVAERVLATVVPGLPVSTGTREVTIFRAAGGEFVVRGTANNVKLQFIFDTGASSVVLRAEDAARIGIDTRRLDYSLEVATANGRAMTAETVMPDLAIGTVREANLPVLVARQGALHENLLGMSFLDRLASFSVAGNKLILRGR